MQELVQSRHGVIHAQEQSTVLSKIPAGIFDVFVDIAGNCNLSSKKLANDRAITLHTGPSETVKNDIEKFFQATTREQYRRFGLMYKRSVLLYGPPGTGKSFLVGQLTQQLVKQDIPVCYLNGCDDLYALHTMLNEIDEQRPVVVVAEEFEAQVRRNETLWMELLDGQHSRPNMFCIFTTNFVDKIPNRIKGRPSRIAKLYWVGAPAKEAALEYIDTVYRDAGVTGSRDTIKAMIAAGSTEG